MSKENLGFLGRTKFGIWGLLVVALLLLSSYAQAATNSYTISDEELYGKLEASFEVSYTQNSNGEYTILSIVIKSVTATFNPLLYSLYYDIEINVFDAVRGLTIDTGKVDGWLLFTNQLSLSNIVFNIASHDPSKRIYVDVYVITITRSLLVGTDS